MEGRHVYHRVPLVGYKRILSYGEDGDGTRSEYVPVFPPQSPGRGGKTVSKGRYKAAGRMDGYPRFRRDTLSWCLYDERRVNEEEVREFARTAIREDLAKVSLLPRCLYNFHPGAHLKQGTAVAIPLIADMVNYAMDQEGLNTTVLFETMAGKGTEVGRTFEEMAEIISRVERKDHVGVCLDTCHVYDGGYDIVNDLDGVLKRFDQIVGLENLKAVHLNDDKNPLGSHKDRHEKIGEGTIGTEAFARIINHPALRELPFFLETPNELPGYKKEIALLRSLRQEE